MAWFVCLEQIACQTLDFFIRFRSDVWPGQRDGRRLFRHAVPGCFPDLKGVLWLGFVCLEQLPARPLIFSFGSGVTFGPGRGTAGGCSVTPCQGGALICGGLVLDYLERHSRTRAAVWTLVSALNAASFAF